MGKDGATQKKCKNKCGGNSNSGSGQGNGQNGPWNGGGMPGSGQGNGKNGPWNGGGGGKMMYKCDEGLVCRPPRMDNMRRRLTSMPWTEDWDMNKGDWEMKMGTCEQRKDGSECDLSQCDGPESLGECMNKRYVAAVDLDP